MMLHEAIRMGIEQALRGLYIGMPGSLEAYDEATGKATVKPLIMEPGPDGVPKSLPPIPAVPVVMPGGANAALDLPPKVGDTGWISFSHRSMEQWLARGGDVPAGDPRVMDLSDAVFWPGLQPFSEGTLGDGDGALMLRGGAMRLKIKDDKIAIGNPDLPILPPLPTAIPITGQLELVNLLLYLLDRLTDPAAPLVIPSGALDIVNPVFTASMANLKANLQRLAGSL
jgi:hypothetical protein